MKPDCKHALVLGLERGIADEFDAQSILFSNAAVLPDLDINLKEKLVCVQGNRASVLRLEKAGFRVSPPDAKPEMQPCVIFLVGRNRKWNEHQISNLWNTLPKGGRLILVGDKTDGIASVRKWLGKIMPITDSFSKYHAVVFWADKSNETTLPLPSIMHSQDGYEFAEGMFSSNGPDKGSLLLAEQFDKRLGGPVADLGAGWGFLSNELLKHAPKVTELALYEADYASLQAAKNNVKAYEGLKPAFHWCDLTTEFKKTPYQWVIMNPPFHTARSADPELGKRFIEVAASTLPTGGRLLMVANQNLPYEQTLEQRFKRFDRIAERDGFKVIEARK
jgi:16S rRNA (guanine1207-N2)-methyltransferase